MSVDTGATVSAPAASLTPEPTAHRQRLASLDAIRGIAALAVVFGHSFEEALRLMPKGSLIRDFIETIFVDYMNLGRIGVVAFFCVSGYVIPFSFSHKKPVPSFIIARFFRLYPAYWASLLLAIAAMAVISAPLPDAFTILANVTMAQTALGQPDVIGVYWTLFYELLFYGMCLLAFLAHRLESPGYLLSVVAALSLLGMAAAFARHTGLAPGVPIGIFMFLAIMHLGTLFRVADRGDGPGATRAFRTGLLIVLLTTGPIAVIGFIQKASGQRIIADFTSLYIGIALFYYLRRSQRVITPGTLFLGRISYSLYLFHPVCLILAVALSVMVPAPFGPIFLVVTIPVSAILLSTVMQQGIEAPFNRFGKMLRSRLLGQ